MPSTLEPGSCGLDTPAFCETFDDPKPGGRGGDLDETVWSLARYGHETRQFFVRIPASSSPYNYPDSKLPPVFCGGSFSNILPDQDVVSCSGPSVGGGMSPQLNEVYDDDGDFAFNSMRVRQPFDFTDRTGTITFDVDAKFNPFNVGHGWWVEFWITDDVVPLPYHEAPGVLSRPRNGVGFAFQECDGHEKELLNRVTRVFVTKDYEIVHDKAAWEIDQNDCFQTADQKLNRFQLKINKDSAELWVSDAGESTTRVTARVSGLDLPFQRGYLHLQHSQYNAHKDGDVGCYEWEASLPGADRSQCVTPVQTYRWDNVGFDGPIYRVPRSYEVPDNDAPDIDGTGGRRFGYPVSEKDWTSLTIPGVDPTGTTRAVLSMSAFMNANRTIQMRLNGTMIQSFTLPEYGGDDGHWLRGFATDLPISGLVSGDNTLELRMDSPVSDGQPEDVANIGLTLEGAY
jgi:hypothetical protein